MLEWGGKQSTTVQHKTEVPPIFVAYQRVSSDGERITLMQVATAVLHAMNDQLVLDAVQPMKQDWYIYMCTLKDRATLVEHGINIMGQFVPLYSEVWQEARQSVKVML